MTAWLCTRNDVRAFLQKSTTDTGQDALIDALIPRASEAVMHFTERELAPATDGATREFTVERSDGELLVDLAPYDLRAVTQVAIDTDTTSPYVLSVDEYRLRPKPAPDGVYQRLELFPFGLSISRVVWRQREVRVTGNWGWPAVPDIAMQATIVTVATWLRNDLSAFSPTLLIDQNASPNASQPFPSSPGQLPPGVRRLLQPLRRMS